MGPIEQMRRSLTTRLAIRTSVISAWFALYGVMALLEGRWVFALGNVIALVAVAIARLDDRRREPCELHAAHMGDMVYFATARTRSE
jgi:hypothetical protein